MVKKFPVVCLISVYSLYRYHLDRGELSMFRRISFNKAKGSVCSRLLIFYNDNVTKAFNKPKSFDPSPRCFLYLNIDKMISCFPRLFYNFINISFSRYLMFFFPSEPDLIQCHFLDRWGVFSSRLIFC